MLLCGGILKKIGGEQRISPKENCLRYYSSCVGKNTVRKYNINKLALFHGKVLTF